jgi:hypothetical protein
MFVAESHDILDERVRGSPGEDVPVNRHIADAIGNSRELFAATCHEFVFEIRA